MAQQFKVKINDCTRTVWRYYVFLFYTNIIAKSVISWYIIFVVKTREKLKMNLTSFEV